MKSVLQLLDLRYTYGTSREKYQAPSKISGPGFKNMVWPEDINFTKSSAQAIMKFLCVEMQGFPLKDGVAQAQEHQRRSRDGSGGTSVVEKQVKEKDPEAFWRGGI